jgi:transposase
MPAKTIKDLATKTEIINQHVQQRKSSYQIAKHFGLASRTIRRFKERKAKGMLIYPRDGRPKSIDEISEEAIIDWINENKHFDRQALQAVILQECKATFMRKHPLYIHNDRRKKNFASRHTVYRYYHYFNTYNGILF